jgi:ribosome-binding factor A
VTSDLSHAKAFYVHPKGFEGQKEADAGFKSVNGFLRHGISERLTIFKSPQLHFEYDRTFEEGTRLSALIDTARADDARVVRDPDVRPVAETDPKGTKDA